MTTPKPFTIEDRISLAEEGLDIYGKDARIFPPLIYVDKHGVPCDPGKLPDDWEERVLKSVKRSRNSTGSLDYAASFEVPCPTHYLAGYLR